MASGTINQPSLPVKYYNTGYIKLNSLTWTQTAGGIYAAQLVDLSNIVDGVIIAANISAISRIRETDVIQPYIISGNTVNIMSNVNSFSTSGSGAQISLLVAYI